MKTLMIIRVFILCVLLLLPACSEIDSVPQTKPQVPSSLSGEWKDMLTSFHGCGEDHEELTAIELELLEKDSTVLGVVTFTDIHRNQVIKGEFKGNISQGRLLGEIELTASGSLYYYDVVLEIKEGLLTGHISGANVMTCADGSQEKRTAELKLIPTIFEPLEPDDLEPNNTPESAIKLEAGDTVPDLTLNAGDVDWFMVTVADTAEVTVTIEFHSYFDARVDVFSEGELSQRFTVANETLRPLANRQTLNVQLLAGRHYLAVTGIRDDGFVGKHSENGVYSLELTSIEVVSDSEYEPNDSREQATALELDFNDDTLYLARKDKDWYTFTLGTMSFVNIGMKGEMGWQLYDTETRIAYSTREATQKLALSEGTYFLEVGRYNYYAGPYELELKREALPDEELEPNNTFEEASEIELDFSATLFVNELDDDWFKFRLDEPGEVSFNVESGNWTEWYLYSDKKEQLEAYETTVLPAGTYYLELPGSYEQVLDLAISVSPLADAEFEPNESASEAALISLDAEYDLYAWEDEKDWFTFTLKQALILDARIQNLSGEITLYDEELNELFGIYSNSRPRHLTKGTYYIEVNPYYQQAYRLLLPTLPVPDAEYEPNQGADAATPITVGFSDENLYIYNGENDWFTFDLSENAIGIFEFSTQGGLKVDLYQGTLGNFEKRLDAHSHSSDYEVYMPADRYYLKLSSQSIYGEGIYAFSLSTKDLPDKAIEPNNDSAQATPINLDEMITSHTAPDDEDWYSFTLTEDNRIQFFLGKSRNSVRAVIYREDLSYVRSHVIQGYSFNQELEPGTYFLRVDSFDDAVLEYPLRLRLNP